MKSGVWFGALSLLAACSSFSADGSENGVGPDGRLPDGGLPPVTGTFTGEVEITVTVAPVTRNRTAKVAFSVKRGFNYAAPVIVRFEGLPTTITSEPLLLEGGTSTGEILLNVGKDTPIGPLRGPKLVAVGQTDDKPTHGVPFEPDVRGAPGDLDLTFGTGGILTVGDSARGSEFDVDAQGRIVVLNDTSIRRFDAEGQAEDPSFVKRTFKRGRSLLVTHRGPSIFVGRNKPQLDIGDGSTGSEIGGQLWKLHADGSVDQAYGTAGFGRPSVNDMTVFAVDTDYRAMSFFPGIAEGAPTQFVISAVGTVTFSSPSASNVARPPYVRGIVFNDDHSAVFAGDHTIAKTLVDTSKLDANFGTVGYRDIDTTVHINALIRDGQANFLVAGHRTDRSVYLTRLTRGGAVDPAFRPQTTKFLAKLETVSFDEAVGPGTLTFTRDFAGKLSVAPNGKIYLAAQVDDAGTARCAVARFLGDGTVDTDFGTDGWVTLPASGCFAHGILRQRDGFVLVGGPVIQRFWE